MKILIVGTNYNSPTDLKTQGQFLRDLLEKEYPNIQITSKYRNYILRILNTIFSILRLTKNDIVIVQVYSSKSIYLELLSVYLAKLKNCTVICTLHGGNMPFVYLTNFFKRILLNKIIKNSDAITAPSTYIPSKISLKNDHLHIIHNFVELDAFNNAPKPNDCIRIFWMRSYHPTYEPLMAIKIFEYIRSQNHPAKLIMAGKDFGHKKETESVVANSKYKSDISVLDVIGNLEKNNIAAHTNVYLCTNKIDNAPVSFLEMMAMGLPVVTTNVGGIPFYVEHNNNALIASNNSVEEMAEMIISLHQNKSLQQQLISNGLIFVKEFSAKVVTQKWIDLIAQLTLQNK